MAKVYSLTALFSLIFSGTLAFAMNLEVLGQIGGLIGVLSAVFFAFMSYRKKLLRTGFDAFRNQYRSEMDDFKEFIRSDINMFREMANKNDERHTRIMERIVELYEKTSKSVEEQSTVCKILRSSTLNEKKLEDQWKRNIKSELAQVKEDVSAIKKSLNHG